MAAPKLVQHGGVGGWVSPPLIPQSLRPGLAQRHRAANADVSRGGADLDFECAGFGDPVLLFRAPVGEGIAVDAEVHETGFAGIERDAAEALELVDRAVDFGVHVVDVELDDLCPGAGSGVLYR